MRTRGAVFSNRLQQACLPVSEVSREIVDWESRAFFRAPAFGHRPQQLRSRGDAFGKRSPLGVAHDALAVAETSSAEFTSRHQRGFRSSGIAALRAHDVGEVDAASLYLNQLLLRGGLRVRNGANFEHLGVA